MKNYNASAWRKDNAIGSVEACKACSMRIVKYREPSTGKLTYASWLGGRHVRNADGAEYTLPAGAEVVWIRDFGGVKALEGL